MPWKRTLCLVACLVLVGLAVGCGSGGDEAPAEETETAPPPSPSGESAEEAAAELLEEEEAGEDIAEADVTYPVVEMETSLGAFQLELYPDKAPKTVENFLSYVRQGFYDGTIFHRVVPNFVIQGGGFTSDMTKKETDPPIENEADNGLRNLRGTICMARTNDPHSATSQFFINTKDNPPLDFRNRSVAGWGYAVFGKVVEGLDVVDAIERVETTTRDGYRDVPIDPVVIESARIIG